jgi:hypothetical protein
MGCPLEGYLMAMADQRNRARRYLGKASKYLASAQE